MSMKPLFRRPRSGRRKVLAVGFLLLAALAGVLYAAYRADLAAAQARVAAGSTVARTPCGPIEYAQGGSGPAVLLVHGAGGGWDQGWELAEALATRGRRVVAMSRFGYLRTPLPADASPAAQADAHACLLDALGIERAAIIGISAGGPSSMQFALRHPDRTSALVLLVALAYRPGPAPEPPSPTARFIYERALKLDFLYWLVMKAAPDVLVETILATPHDALENAGAGEQERAYRLLEHILPLSARQAGLRNDSAIAQNLGRYDLESIAVPTLVMSLPDDLFGTYEGARYTAAMVPGARFVDYPSGGHVWIGRHAQVLGELDAFLGTP
ncbi:MAG TPA: alpha/beta hydrolase [Myxococcota bacterium]|nr:alpha/beta hydrolase [Myxococcota bacterium]